MPEVQDGKERQSPEYLEVVQDAINDRERWNKKDSLILKRRLGDRKLSRRKYRNAPEPVVPIIDDTTRDRSEQEISMIMNAPRIAHFIPLNPETPQDIVQKAEIAFDTFLRHYMNYRRVKDEEVDTKNARGFAITKMIREKNDQLGAIPSAVSVDPKDCIVKANTKSPKSAEMITHVLRFSIKELKRKKKAGWKNVDVLLARLGATSDYSSISSNGSTSSGMSTTRYSQSDDETDPLRVTERLVGLNTSNIRGGEIVIWEVYHKADEWDKAHDWTDEIEIEQPCMTYFCPDQPELLLNIKAWRYPDTIDVVPVVDDQGVLIQETTVTEKGEWRPCPYVQHRFENRAKWWYDSRGLGHLNMDNQLVATGVRKRGLTLLDYYTNPVFLNDGTGGTNPTNVRLDAGNVLPKGVKPAVLPTPPPSLDFNVDQQKREASLRSGAGMALWSGDISATRKVQKTATEQQSQDAKSAMLSSAGVDRFNDADKELFAMLWADLKQLDVQLPLISNNRNLGAADSSIYDHEFLIVPASSQKTLNPDAQFMKFQQVFGLMMQSLQVVPNQDVEAQLKHGLAYYDPHFADIALIDPEKPEDGQAPIFQQLDQIKQGMEQLAQMVESVGKLAVENSEKVEDDPEDNRPSVPSFIG